MYLSLWYAPTFHSTWNQSKHSQSNTSKIEEANRNIESLNGRAYLSKGCHFNNCGLICYALTIPPAEWDIKGLCPVCSVWAGMFVLLAFCDYGGRFFNWWQHYFVVLLFVDANLFKYCFKLIILLAAPSIICWFWTFLCFVSCHDVGNCLQSICVGALFNSSSNFYILPHVPDDDFFYLTCLLYLLKYKCKKPIAIPFDVNCWRWRPVTFILLFI